MFKKGPGKGPVPGSSKSKNKNTNSKDRKKILPIQNHGETSNTNTMNNLINNKLHNSNNNSEACLSYVGFHPDTISMIAEQYLGIDDISQVVSEALAEDISYKMRELLSVATLNMHHAKRNYLKCSDVDSAFRKLNLEPVHGSQNPNWTTFGDPSGYSCSLSQTVDLVEVSTEESSIVEPGDMGLEYKWFKDVIPINNQNINMKLKRYCDSIMKYSISSKDSLRLAVLKDVSRNTNIGPVIPALCNFCFLILQKNITYSSLAVPVLQLLETIMLNPCTSFSAEEKQITLLIYLLLESIMNASNIMTFEVTSTCRTLGRMCICWTIGGRIIVDKITKHLPPEPFRRLTAPVITALNHIGNDALNQVLWPHIEQVFHGIENLHDLEKMDMLSAILDSARLFYKQENCDRNTNKILVEELGEKLIPLCDLKNLRTSGKSEAKLDQLNSIQLRKQLMKTYNFYRPDQDMVLKSTKPVPKKPKIKPTYNQVFKKSKTLLGLQNSSSIQILGKNFKPLQVRKKIVSSHTQYFSENQNSEVNSKVIKGRRTLLTIKKQFLSDSVNFSDPMMYNI